MNNNLVAAIDFGTNTARLLVADRHPDGSFVHVRLEREIVRMGGGFSREHGLSADAMERGSGCLGRFSNILKQYGITNPRAVATSAVRDALNGPAFLESIRRQTGIALSIIDGEREGALTLAGVIAGLDRQHDNLMVFDVGGGSTEYTLAHKGHADFIKSLPLGVVRLTEGKTSPAEMSVKIGKELDLLVGEIKQSGNSVCTEDTVLVGTAGTATTLAAINMKMDSYDYRKVNNSLLTLDEIKSIYSMLLPLSPEERITVPGLEKGREDLIVAGILITVQTMERFGFTVLKVSDYGLLEGLIAAADPPAL
ncbi:MAG: exopolyphosphatase [Geobacteraceae bacterium]|nr:exopolyphosphatase [Geobacteraceae bacterium]